MIGGVPHNVVTSPSGIKYRFSTGDVNSRHDPYYYLTSKTDPMDNTITVTYRNQVAPPTGADAKTAYIQTITQAVPNGLGGTVNRVVTFVYRDSALGDPDPLDKIQVKNASGVTVDYVYIVGGDDSGTCINGGTLGASGHQGLLCVRIPTTPTNLITKYNYALRSGESAKDVELKKVTLPTGQMVDYYYQDHNFDNPFAPFGTTECTRVVDKKDVIGIGLWEYGKPGNLALWPTGTPTDNVTVVRDPLGNEVHSTLERHGTSGSNRIWRAGLLLHREIRDVVAGTIRTEDNTYSSKQINSADVAPGTYFESLQDARLDSTTVTVTGAGGSKTFATAYSAYDDYGNPGVKDEKGYPSGTTLIRRTEYTYAHGTGGQWLPTAIYIVDRPSRVVVRDSDGTTLRADTKFTYYTTNPGVAALGQVQRQERWADKLGDFAVANKYLQTDYEYDNGGDSSKRTLKSPSGDRVSTLVHAYGALRDLSDQEGVVFTRVVHPDTGLVTSERDPNNRTTTFGYDNLYRLTAITPPLGDPTVITYDNATAKVVTVTRGVSETRYEYDGLGRQMLTRRLMETGLYACDKRKYDALSRVSKSFESVFQTDCANLSDTSPGSNYTYDALGRIKTLQDPFGTTTYSYGATPDGPETVKITYPVSGIKKLTYDALSRLVSVLDERGFTTTYSYDPIDQLKTVDYPGTVPNRVVTPNTLGWTIREDAPESGVTRYEYNDFGELSRRDDANLPTPRSLTLTYDLRGRVKTSNENNVLVSTVYYDGDTIPGCGTCLAGYTNPLGNRTGSADSISISQWPDHDVLNRPLTRRTVLEGSTFVESYGYDSRGNLTQRNLPKLDGQADRAVISMTANHGNKIKDIFLNGSTTIASSVTYNAAFRLNDIPLGNGATIQRPTTASLRNRPDVIRTVGVLSAGGAASDLTLDYGYDACGRIGTVVTNGRLDTYAYTARNELDSASYTGQGSVAYTYDETGNITQQSSAAFPQLNFTRTHTNNRIVGFNYDTSGRLTGDGVNTYGYDNGGRLFQVLTAQGTHTYRYDGENHRRTSQKPDGSKQLYFYSEAGDLLSTFSLPAGGSPAAVEDAIYLDGERIATRRYPELSDPGNSLRADVVAPDVLLNWGAPACTNKVDVKRATVKDFTDGTTIASGVGTQNYTDVGEGAVLANKFYLIVGPQPSLHFHINDHLRSTRLVVDENRKTEASYEYFPYGAMKSEICPQLNGGFHGKERDAADGGQDFGVRYFSSSLARFPTPDPSRDGIAFTHPVSWNAYMFNLNSPMEFVDRDGRNPGPFYYPGPLPLVDLKVGSSILDNSIVGAFNTAVNIIYSAGNVYLNAGESLDPVLTPMIPFAQATPIPYDDAIVGLPLAIRGLGVGLRGGFVAGEEAAPLFRAMDRVAKGASRGADALADTVMAISEWLGADARGIQNASGDMVFVNKTGTRRVRFDLNNPHPHQNPHMHVEELIDGKWDKSGPIYPTDVPNN